MTAQRIRNCYGDICQYKGDEISSLQEEYFRFESANYAAIDHQQICGSGLLSREMINGSYLPSGRHNSRPKTYITVPPTLLALADDIIE